MDTQKLTHILRHGEKLPYDGELRSANIDPMFYVVVAPTGFFHKAPVASNLADGVITVDEGKVYVRPAAAEKGFTPIHELADDAAQCELLYQYFDWEIEHGGKVEAMPKELLPAKVAERRKTATIKPQFKIPEPEDAKKTTNKRKAQ